MAREEPPEAEEKSDSSDRAKGEPRPAPARPEPTSPAGVPGALIAIHGQLALSSEKTETILISPYISPTDLRAYAAIDPELARRLVEHNLASIDRAAAEEAKENEHRRKLEKEDQRAEIADRIECRKIESRGQRWAGIIALVGFALCAFAVHEKQGTVAVWLGCTTIVVLISAFIAGRVLAKSSARPGGGSPPEGPPGPKHLPPDPTGAPEP